MFIVVRNTNEMVVFEMDPPTSYVYVALFSTRKKLVNALAKTKIKWDTMKQLNDKDETFVNSLPRFHCSKEVKIIVDPFSVSETTTQYTEIKRPPIISELEQLN